jgi:hypothetical protein
MGRCDSRNKARNMKRKTTSFRTPLRSLLCTLGGLAAVLVCASASVARAQTVTPLLVNGPDANKKVIAIIGDGYAAGDQATYAADADSLVASGVFAQDATFHAIHTAFNVYRIDAVSTDSGVSTRTYDEKGTPRDGADDTILSETKKNTALGYIYSGSWSHCWLEGSATTETKIQNILAATVPNYDFVVVILNSPGFGGCGGGGRQVVTRGVGWQVMAHEFGHGIGGLYDEYGGSGAYTGAAITSRNCTTNKTRATISWSSQIDAATPVPTTFTTGMDPNETVGAFAGCGTFDSGIYRPVHNCRMNGNTPEYCPVCNGLIREAYDPFLDEESDYLSNINRAGGACKAVGSGVVTVNSTAQLENGSASAVDVNCPTFRLLDADLVFGKAFVIDRHPTENVCCEVFSKNPGGTLEVNDSVCSSGASTSRQILDLNFPKVYDPFTFSHFGVRCKLPAAHNGAKSKLLTYRVTQQKH